jgi:N-acetylneuraminic acid mutarotase
VGFVPHGAGDPPAAGAECVCAGDCNSDCHTTEEEIDRTLGAIFDTQAFGACPAADADRSGTVGAADLVLVLIGVVEPPPECSGTPPVPTPTATSPTVPGATGTPTRTATPVPPGTPRSEWITLAPLAAGPRQELGVALLGETVYAIGGFGGEGRVEAYDVGTNQWRRVADLPAARNHVGAAALGGLVYSVGGFAGIGFTPTRDVYRYGPGAEEWETVAPLPTARGALAVATLGGALHAIGGSGAGGSVARHDCYIPETNSWMELAPLPSARNHLAASVVGGMLYVIGGRRDGAGNVNTAELDRYDAAADRWEVLAPMPTARSGLAAAVLDGRLVVLGGEVNSADPLGVFPQVEVYDPETRRWTSLDAMAVPRHGTGAASAGGLIYVPGGATRAGFGATAHHDALRISW